MPRAIDSAAVIAGAGVPEPDAGDPQSHLAWQLRVAGRGCGAMGSPLYASLLEEAAADVEDGGPTWQVLAEHVAPGRGDALALRLMAAVHRLVLTGRAPELARHYPSVGGHAQRQGAWEVFRRVLASQTDTVRDLVALPCQTNEVGRCAGLVGGFLHVAHESGLPLRLLEVGASAGLNLRWDAFCYGGGGSGWGPAGSPVDLTGHWVVPPPHTDVEVEVVERSGCDPRPVDPSSAEGRLSLTASIWADQTARFERLRGAIQIAERIPATVEPASVADWLPAKLADPAPATATVVYHSVVEEYLPGQARQVLHDSVRAAGQWATSSSPVAWLRLEPISQLRSHGITLTTWPGGQERQVARCGAHGSDVRWLEQPQAASR